MDNNLMQKIADFSVGIYHCDISHDNQCDREEVRHINLRIMSTYLNLGMTV